VTGATTITRHLEQLRVYLDRLAELQQSSRESLRSDWHVQAMVERNLQLAVEAVISISEQVIASLSLRTPESSREALAVLADEQIIPRDLAVELQLAVGFRNIIVHQYMGIDYDLVYDVLQNDLGHLEAFLAAISIYLQSHDLP
jgi:uncharacterized protein YutE (UPF0331/DUF86 family)